MKFYNIHNPVPPADRYRLPGTGLLVNFWGNSFWPAFPAYFIGIVLIFGHFFFGPMRLIQEYMECGDMDGAEKVLIPSNFQTFCTSPSALYIIP